MYDSSATSSYMSSPYLGSVTDFCDDTGDNLHDKDLPNKQNLYCEERSTWEVILSGSSGIAHNSSKAPEPSFVTVRSSMSNVMFVLLMDMSKSMLAGTGQSKG